MRSMADEKEKSDAQLLEEMLDKVGRLVLKGGSVFRSFREELLGDIDERLQQATRASSESEVDPFGMDVQALRRTALGAAFFYKIYFRCISTGLENIPDGPVILVSNHAGQIPIDGVMITTALVVEKTPPRYARSMVDRWVPSLPYVSTFYSRVGVAVGTTENAERLLRRGEVLLIFPEGMEAITKTIDRAYQLEPFSLGFMRLALTTGAPIVPVSVVGSEEQYPTLYNIKSLAKILGVPSMPIWIQMLVPVIGMLPLPVRYHLNFGKPMTFEGNPDDEDAVIQEKADTVKAKIQHMLDETRANRKSVFF